MLLLTGNSSLVPQSVEFEELERSLDEELKKYQMYDVLNAEVKIENLTFKRYIH